MSEDPKYHEQPSTLDPNIEIPEDAPRAQGHGEEDAEVTRDAAQELKDGLEDEQPEKGQPRAPGDHAEKPKAKTESKKS
jgi:hypothetical protein